MISSPFILKLNFTHFSMALLNQSLLQPIYLLKLYHSSCQFTRANTMQFILTSSNPMIKFPYSFATYTQ
jgi:hypothetical protein